MGLWVCIVGIVFTMIPVEIGLKIMLFLVPYLLFTGGAYYLIAYIRAKKYNIPLTVTRDCTIPYKKEKEIGRA